MIQAYVKYRVLKNALEEKGWLRAHCCVELTKAIAKKLLWYEPHFN